MEWCDNFWGTHGCGLPKGHPGPHRCGADDAEPCSEHDGITSVRYYEHHEDGTYSWSEWMTTVPTFGITGDPRPSGPPPPPPPLNVYTCNDHDGFYPVGTASVIVAPNEIEARQMLRAALGLRGLNAADDSFNLTLLPLHEATVRVLSDGSY